MDPFRKLLVDFRLTTVEIIYRMPDYPDVLLTFIWQDYDLPPDFPRLQGFLEFWTRSLDGKIHSVYIMSAPPLAFPKINMPGFLRTLH